MVVLVEFFCQIIGIIGDDRRRMGLAALSYLARIHVYNLYEPDFLCGQGNVIPDGIGSERNAAPRSFPENGFYFFREVGKGTWVITSDIKIVRILTESERKEIMLKKGYDEKAAFKKYKETLEKRMGIAG